MWFFPLAAVLPFFVLDNGTGRDQRLPPAEQAELARRAGYDGIGCTTLKDVPAMLRALDERNMKMFAVYHTADIEGGKTVYDPLLPEVIRLLKGRDTQIWLAIRGRPADGEARATALVREVAGMAADSGLRVALYPHRGFYVERVEDALRIRKRAGARNAGVTFNLAHFLSVKDDANLDRRLGESMPALMAVTINGADREGGGWDRLIQPLGSGDYDVLAFLRKLVSLGYRGPVGLQCYKVPGGVEENLARSMSAWRRFSAALAAGR